MRSSVNCNIFFGFELYYSPPTNYNWHLWRPGLNLPCSEPTPTASIGPGGAASAALAPIFTDNWRHIITDSYIRVLKMFILAFTVRNIFACTGCSWSSCLHRRAENEAAEPPMLPSGRGAPAPPWGGACSGAKLAQMHAKASIQACFASGVLTEPSNRQGSQYWLKMVILIGTLAAAFAGWSERGGLAGTEMNYTGSNNHGASSSLTTHSRAALFPPLLCNS